MKPSTILLGLAATLASGHTIFQRVSVGGVEQGQTVGVRVPANDNPVQNINDAALACNLGLVSPQSSAVITIPAGSKVGTWWQHVLGGAQSANDADNPIAKSHKGPIQVYLAKVDNAATAGTSGLKWFKVASEGLSGGKWAVDNMIAGNGWWYFTMPSCVAPGQYLMRAELLALHSASTSGGAQFYMSCANIQVTGSGTASPSTVSIPGVYPANDPGIVLSIYGTTGQPDNGGKAYAAPGPAVLSCSSTNTGETTGGTTGGSTGGTTTTPTTGTAALYGQCGGTGWTGATTCASGSCVKSGDYYSQCLP